MPRSFFVDFNAANDSANGTDTSTPWKRCPGMTGFAGSYAHQTGDQFFFKKGVTWTGVWPLTISAGGSSGTPDYYGTQAGFGSGLAVFDFENNFTSTGYGVGINANNVTFGEGLDLKRLKSPTWFGAGGTITGNGAFSGIRITNAVIRDWCLATPIPASSGGAGGGIYAYNGAVITVDNCTFHQQNSATINGVVCYNVNDVSFCDIGYCAEALHGGGHYHDNHIHNLLDGTDPQTHQAAIVTYIPSTIYNNLIHDLTGRNAPIELWGATSGAVSNSTDLVYNNVIYNAGVQPCVWIGNDSSLYNTHTVKLYNNTLNGGSGWCFSNRASTNAALGTLDARNNHFITTTNPLNINDPSNLGGPVTNLTAPTQPTVGGNLIQTPAQAAAAGYTSSNNYQPTGAGSPTVGVGANLSAVFTIDRLNATRTVPWDVGAYEFASGGGDTTPPSVGISSPANGATVSGTISVTATASDNVGVTSVEFLVDGVSKSTDSSAPYSYSLDTTAFADGSHTIQTVARDAAGNSSSATVSVTVRNAVASAIIGISPSSLDWGSVPANGTPTDKTITVTNNGPAGTTLSGTASVASPFSIVSGGTYTALGSGVSQSVTIRYRPVAKANDSATVTFTGGGGTTATARGICYPVLVGLGPHNASSGIVTAPFVVSNTTDVVQNTDTQGLPVSSCGRLSFGISTPPGPFTIRLLVQAQDASQNSIFVNIDAEPTDPGMIADIVTLTTGFELRTLSWRGNGTFDAPQFNPKTFALSSGLHEVVIRGREQLTAIRSIELVSAAPPPPPALTVTTTATPSSGEAPLTVAFTSTVSGGTSPYSYAWAFGDAGTSTSASPNHTYSGAGTYNAVLTVTDSGSPAQVATATTTIPVTSPPPPPIALFISASPDTGTTPLAVAFTSTVSGGTASYSYAWAFDDSGATSTSANPSHTYNSAGTYHPSLTVTDSSTSPQTATRSITITDSAPPPSPLGTGISATPNRDVVPLSVAFAATPGGGTGPYSFAWDFGDSTGTSTDRTPSYVYTVPGDYVVHLTVTDSGSPAQTAQAMVQITALPLPLTLVVTAAPTTGTAPLPVAFAAIPAGGVSLYTYAWTFGDSGTSVLARPSHTYSAAGTYTASCTVTDSASVTASTQLTVVVSAASPDPLVPAILYVVP